ncbi:hypothetical protein D9M71_754440 [compost metagenome]
MPWKFARSPALWAFESRMEPARRLLLFASTPDGAVAGSADFFARERFLLPESGEEKAPQSLGLEAFTGKKLGSCSSCEAGFATARLPSFRT